MSADNPALLLPECVLEISLQNLMKMSRTANGIVDVSASSTKKDVILVSGGDEAARKAFILGVPTALTLDTVAVSPCYGVMYEMIGADSVLGYVYKNPSDYDSYILKFATA